MAESRTTMTAGSKLHDSDLTQTSGTEGRSLAKWTLALAMFAVVSILALYKAHDRVERRRHALPALLCRAASGQTADTMESLIAEGADIDAPCRTGSMDTPLRSAVMSSHGRLEHVRFAIGRGANINDGSLSLAASFGYLDVTQVLLSHGADTEVFSGRNAPEEFSTPVCAAANGNHPEIVKALLEHGANVNGRDARDRTGLILASARGLTDIIRLLLSAGADVNAQTAHGPERGSGYTALMYALSNGHGEAAGYLLKHGADITIRGDDGATGLTLAIALMESGNPTVLPAIRTGRQRGPW